MKKSVFFIDDDETYLYLLERSALKFTDSHLVHSAYNGADALEKLKKYQQEGTELPNIMFVDINMPVMDGFEFLDEFKKQREFLIELQSIVPILMLTSSEESSDKSKVLSTGIVSDYIVKPFGTKNIEQMLAKFLS